LAVLSSHRFNDLESWADVSKLLSLSVGRLLAISVNITLGQKGLSEQKL